MLEDVVGRVVEPGIGQSPRQAVVRRTGSRQLQINQTRNTDDSSEHLIKLAQTHGTGSRPYVQGLHAEDRKCERRDRGCEEGLIDTVIPSSPNIHVDDVCW